MKLLTMKRIKGEGAENGERDLFVELENDNEREIYCFSQALFIAHKKGVEDAEYMYGEGKGIIEGMLSMGLGRHYTDEDIYYYFSLDGEKVPAIGEEWELDDIVWKRVS